MTDEQFKEMLKALKTVSDKRNGWAEMLMRGGVSVSTAGIIFIGSLLWKLNNNVTVMMATQASHSASISYLQSFAREPRFTQDMYNIQSKALSDRIDTNKTSIEKLERKIYQ